MSDTSILDRAAEIVDGDRQSDYGTPERSLERIADHWNTYLFDELKPGCAISAKDVAMMMVLLKVSREAYSHKLDNLVDGAGYLELAARCEV